MLKRAWILSFVLPALLPAALLRIEVSERSDVLDGKAFASAGPYERIVGKAYFAVDPNLPANKIVADIAKAPRNQDGLVEFSADFDCLKPRDPQHGNHAVLFEVSNRGGKGMLGTFGEDFLMEQGYTLVWLGWEFDVPPGPNALRLYAPVAQGITGLVRSEITLDHKATRQSLGDRSQLAYPVLNPDDPALTLTVREHADSSRRAVARDAWHIEGGTHIAMPAGFETGKIYELVYTSKDPPIVGLGPAAVRDLISFFKYGIAADTILGDHHDFIKRAYGFGISQSGRFLRTFVYYGFNQDEQGRRVFDGLMAHVAGAGRGSFNHRFAQPSRDGHPFLNTFYPTDIFPFTDLAETDAETGITDGLLTHATPPAAVPKIFYTNTSYEYYGRSASLIHTTLDGAKDAPLAPNTRIYFLAGCQHGPSPFPPDRGEAQNLANPNNYRWTLRALLVALDGWVAKGLEPPPSRYPKIAERQTDAAGRGGVPEAARRAVSHAYPAGMARGLRRRIPQRRNCDDRAAQGGERLSGAAAAGGCGRQRHGGHPDAGDGGPAGDLYRMESALGGDRRAGRVIQHGGIVHSVRAHEGGADEDGRSAAVRGRTVRQ